MNTTRVAKRAAFLLAIPLAIALSATAFVGLGWWLAPMVGLSQMTGIVAGGAACLIGGAVVTAVWEEMAS